MTDQHWSYLRERPWRVKRRANGTLEALGPMETRLEFNDETAAEPRLRLVDSDNVGLAELVQGTIAVLEATLARQPAEPAMHLALDGRDGLATALLERGIAVPNEAGGLIVDPAMFWQRPEPWTDAQAHGSYPFSPVMTGGRRHPGRPPKPRGQVYARWIPWLDQTLSFQVATVDDHLDLFHGWMNDPRVDQFFEEAGSLSYHRDYLQRLTEDPATLPLIGCIDGDPFAYFEIYWAQESRLGPYYDAGDYDRGWHVLVGEDAYRGKAYVAAWLPSVLHWMFLDEPRTQRIVGEPAAAHQQQLRNLERSGFARLKTFGFPHKRAALVMLTRERFFGDGLWHPSDPSIAPTPWLGETPAPVNREQEVAS